MPGNLVATAISPSQISLSWGASTDNVGVAGYKIYRDGNLLNTSTVVTGTSYTDFVRAGSYSYKVAAYDVSQNFSPSTSASITVIYDILPPSTPENLQAIQATLSAVSLSWASSTDNVGVSGYVMYRNGAKIATTTTATPSYIDSSIVAGS